MTRPSRRPARFASLRSAPLVGRSRSHARCPYRARCRCGDHCLSHGGADHARPAFAPPARPGAHRRPGNRHRGHRRPAAATVRRASLMLSTCSEGEKHCGGARSRIQPGDVGFDRSRSVSDGASVDDCEELDSASSVSLSLDAPSGRKVESPRDPICERLALALARWTAEPNANVLRRALLEVLIAIQ